jgi:hypothetical protein
MALRKRLEIRNGNAVVTGWLNHWNGCRCNGMSAHPRKCDPAARSGCRHVTTTTSNSPESTVGQFARLVITTGPERGKVFEFDDELVHLGRASENQIVLDDPSLSEHHASLLHKNGRYAIYRPSDSEVRVDGAEIPAETWVWLPTDTRMQFGRRTSCQFSYELSSDTAPRPVTAGPPGAAADESVAVSDESDDVTEDTNVSRNSQRAKSKGSSSRSRDELTEVTPADEESAPASDEGAGRRRSKSKSKSKSRSKSQIKPGRHVARFITDRGDTLVELGADGHLPELALDEGPQKRKAATGPKQTSPVVLYCILGLSFVMTIGMLLIDFQPAGVSPLSRQQAREEIVKFFGSEENDELKPWQESLRRARLAHSQRDFAVEIREYRKVIDVLNAEDRDPHIGVTGHLETDKELKRLIGNIIGR